MNPDDIQRRIADNLARVEERIEAACGQAGRSRDAVRLVAVSKTRPLEVVRAALACGISDLGENRLEELGPKREALAEAYPQVAWHMIGHLQSRKARQAAECADWVHSVDTLKLARRLDRYAEETGHVLPVLLEVNVSGEASKAGFAAANPGEREAFLEDVQSLAELEHLAVRGLMTMAPIVAEAEQARPVFAALRDLRNALTGVAPWSAWPELSMGMTDDFPVAIEEGATMVRIGRAIFDLG